MPRLLVDTQIHVWGPNTPEQPWTGDGEPSHGPEFTGDDALRLMASGNVAFGVLIEPSWTGFANKVALDSAHRHAGRFAVLARFDPSAADSGSRLERLLADRAVVGIRLVLTNEPGLRWVEAGGLLGTPLSSVWPILEDAGRTVLLRTTDHLEQIGALAQKHPGLAIVVDHAGVRATPGPDAFEKVPQVAALSCHPNVYVKVSGLTFHSKVPPPYGDLEPWIHQLVSRFGAERCMWGSDFTRLRSHHTYADIISQFQTGYEFLTEADRDAILVLTAIRVFGFQPFFEPGPGRDV
jgi:predicted TIM-barrel fold metal-dependent hydrolase